MQNRETQAAVTLGDRTSNRGPISHPRGGLEPPTKTIIRRQLSALSTAARLAESPEWSETAGQRAGRPSIWCCRDHSAAKSMSRALVHDCLGNNRLVRSSDVLSAPPYSLTQTEISRFSANSPELAGIRVRILSPQSVDWISRALSWEALRQELRLAVRGYQFRRANSAKPLERLQINY